MKRPRIVLADDHSIFLDGLCRLLEPEFEVVAKVNDGRKLIAAVSRLRPDVAIVDVSMPSLNGIDSLRKMNKSRPRTKFIMLTMHADAAFALEAFAAGASAYVVKAADCDELLKAMREALKGRVYITPRIAKDVLFAKRRDGLLADQPSTLTPRQREVLQLVAEGYTAKEIAGVLGVSLSTVEFHKAALMRRLDINSTAGLVKFAMVHGLAGSSATMRKQSA